MGRKLVSKKDEESMIGKIIDMPLKDFKEQLVVQKVNVGTINNIILNLECAYNDLRTRKDGVLNTIINNDLDRDNPQINGVNLNEVLKGLYAEMTKVEEKITYLKELSKKLVNVG